MCVLGPLTHVAFVHHDDRPFSEVVVVVVVVVIHFGRCACNFCVGRNDQVVLGTFVSRMIISTAFIPNETLMNRGVTNVGEETKSLCPGRHVGVPKLENRATTTTMMMIIITKSATGVVWR